MATFLLPSLKLKTRNPQTGETVEEMVHKCLMKDYNGYTVSAGNIFGYWKDDKGEELYGEHREYKVSFAGKEKIDYLSNYLAYVALLINESCIYFETGEDSWLIYPTEEFRQSYQNYR